MTVSFKSPALAAPKRQHFDLEIDAHKAVLRFTLHGRPLVHDPRPQEDRPPLLSHEGARASSVSADEGFADSPWFAFWAEDCAFPVFHVIRAQSWEDAYEVFCEQEADRGHYLIQEGDPDYSEDDGHWTGDGRRVDTECFQGAEVTLASVEVLP